MAVNSVHLFNHVFIFYSEMRPLPTRTLGMHDTKMYAINTVGVRCVYPCHILQNWSSQHFFLCVVLHLEKWNPLLIFLLSDSLSARALEGLYNHYLPFHLAFTKHEMHSVVTPQYQQNTIQSLTIYLYIHSFHFKFPNDEFEEKKRRTKEGGGGHQSK